MAARYGISLSRSYTRKGWVCALSYRLIMLVYGVSVAIGNIYGGKLADKKAQSAR